MKRVKLNKIVTIFTNDVSSTGLVDTQSMAIRQQSCLVLQSTSSLSDCQTDNISEKEAFVENVSLIQEKLSDSHSKKVSKKKILKRESLFENNVSSLIFPTDDKNVLKKQENQHLIYPDFFSGKLIPIVKDITDFSNKKLAMFDFDGTLVKPKDGRRFPQNRDDWKYLFSNVREIFLGYHKEGYQMLIITDQTHDWKVEMIMEVLKNMDEYYKEHYVKESNILPLNVHVIIHREKDSKKPNTEYFLKEIGNFKKELSFYVGDACGRVGDWSNVDLEFSKNLGIQFNTPECVFLIEDNSFETLSPTSSVLTKSLNEKLIPSFIPIDTLLGINTGINPGINQEIILMVGLPGSGKSTYIDQEILKKYGDQYKKVSGDDLKTESKMLKVCREILKQGQNAIIDATNVSKKKREVYIELSKELKISIRCIFLKKSLETVLEQNQKRNAYLDKELLTNGVITKKKVPNVAIYTSNKKMEEPTKEEGFEEIIIII